MPNQLSAGTVYVGDVEVASGQIEHVIVGSVARTDTSAKTLGAIPAGSQITSVSYIGQTASNAGTTGVLKLGYSGGTGLELISSADVIGSGTGLNPSPTTSAYGAPLTAAKVIVGKYAETGTASSTGGPWYCVVKYVTNKTS